MRFKTWLENNWQRFGHQKYFPWMRDYDRPFQRKASSLLGKDVEDYGLDDSQYDVTNLYHVTRSLSAVKTSGKLLSRAQLGYKVMGLGGGNSNMSPNTVSLTYSLAKAKEIYDAFQLVAKIVANQVPASQIYDYVNSFSNWQGWDEEELGAVDELLVQCGVPEESIRDGNEEEIRNTLDKTILTAQDRYEFLRDMEKAVIDDNPQSDSADYVEFDPVVGFTADFSQMKDLKTKDIAIIQCVVRKDAKIEHYVQEAEIRVPPEYLAIVRFMQPG